MVTIYLWGRYKGANRMSGEGPPLLFVALWGTFALLMLLGQMQLIERGSHIATSYQIFDSSDPIAVAALD
jgi:hypothetical protein